jgi:hypothetical protein
MKAPDFSKENQLQSAIEELKVPFVQKIRSKKDLQIREFQTILNLIDEFSVVS